MKKKERSFSKKIDTYAGIPLLFALSGLWPGRSGKPPRHISRAAFIRMESSRDTVLTESAAKAFKERYPESELVYFTGKDNYGAASLIASVDKVIEIYPESIRKSVSMVKASGFFDLWVDFGPWSRFESIITLFAEAGYKIGFRTEGEFRHFAYDAVADLVPKRHLCDNIASLMILAGIKICSEPHFAAPAPAEKNLVIFNMFPDRSEHGARRWGEENWKYLLSRLSKKGYRIALTGNKADYEEADKFTESLGSNFDVDYLVGRLEGRDLLETLSKASLVISVDSWILYAAAAMNVPVLGLYGPTSPEMYAPVGSRAGFIKSGAACCGCQNIYGEEACRLNEPVCMDSIDRGLAEQEAFKILERHL